MKYKYVKLITESIVVILCIMIMTKAVKKIDKQNYIMNKLYG